MTPLVSVCICSYNHEKYIEYCIESIFSQDYRNVEILVIDDGSTDGSLNLLNDLKSKSPFPMTVLSQKNSGFIGKNFNKLFSMAKGKYVSIISSDDALLSDAISKKVKIMEDDSRVQFVINSQIRHIDNQNNIIGDEYMPLNDYKEPLAQDILNLDFKNVHSYYLQGSLFRKSLIDAIGGYDESMLAEDIVLRTKISHYMIQNPQLSFVLLHEIDCLYRRHNSNVSTNHYRQVKSVAMYFDKYWENESVSKSFDSEIRAATKDHPFKMFLLSIEYSSLKVYMKYIIRFIFKYVLQKIFSSKNSSNGTHKIITILGIKIKTKKL